MPESGNALWRVLGTLGDSVRKQGNGWEARCPAHEDHHASLSVGIGLDGRVLLDCHAGCPAESVVAAVGLTMADLFEKSAAGNPVRRFRLLDTNGQTVAVHAREDLPHDKKLWWESNGKRGLNGTSVVSLPLYRLPDLLAADLAAPAILVEGEKAADALVSLGLLAVGTVTGAAAVPCDASLEVLNGHKVWVWPDNDEPGRQHMARITSRLKADVWRVVWPDAPLGGDAADYVAAGGTAEGIRVMLERLDIAAAPRPTTTIQVIGGLDLARARFDQVRWAIPGILPSGLAILAGRPKLGKSWLVLGWVLDIALGTPVLRKLPIQQGETLYLALEDSQRRMQERQARLIGDRLSSNAFQIATAWPRMGEGGIEALEDWFDTHVVRLVVIDTFKRFRPKEQKTQRLYDLDYDAIAPLAELAARRNVAIVLVFHTNKLDPSDPIDLVSGTLGLSGAADGVLVLKRERGQADASLFVTGRDVEEQDLALKWERDDPFGWALLGQASDFRRSKERQEILDVVKTMPGMTPTEIANATQRKVGTVKYLLFVMVRDEEIRNRDGHYYLLDTTPIAPNPLSSLSSPLVLSPDSTSRPSSPDSTDRGGRASGQKRCRVCRRRLFPDEQEVCERCR